MKTISYIISALVIGGLVGFFGRPLITKPEMKVIKESIVKTVPFYKNIAEAKKEYNKMPTEVWQNRLVEYDQGPFDINGHFWKDNIFRVDVVHGERYASKDFQLKIGESSHFKYYVAIAGIGLLTGGYIVYKLKNN